MKGLVLACIVAWFAAGVPLGAQHAYIDAVRARSNLQLLQKSSSDANAAADLRALIGQYYGTPEKLSDIAKNVAGNPYLSEVFKSLQNVEEPKLQGVAGAAAVAAEAGGLNVSTIADGLTRFLIKRAQQETIAYFMEDYRAFIADYPEIQTLFPDTFQYLSRLPTADNYQGLVQNLGGVVRRDVTRLPMNVLALQSIPKGDKPQTVQNRIDRYEKFFDSDPEGDAATILAYLAADLIDGTSVPQVLNHLSAVAEQREGIRPAGAKVKPRLFLEYIRLSNLLSESLRAKAGEGTIWVSESMIKSQPPDAVLGKLYLGFLYATITSGPANDIQVGGDQLKPIMLSVVLHDQAANANELFDALQTLIATYQKIDRELKDWQDATTRIYGSSQDQAAAIDRTISLYLAIIGDLYDARTGLAWLAPYAAPAGSSTARELESLHECVTLGLTIVQAVHQKDYRTAFIKLAPLLQQVMESTVNPAGDGTGELIWGNLSRYGSFAAALAQAESEADVENVLETYAAPVGSYRTKADSSFSINLNAYVGGAGAAEIRGAQSHTIAVASVFAPVGIALSGPSAGGSSSLFIGLIDLGAVMSFRLAGSAYDTLPDLTWANLFAPSLNYVFGIPKTPFAIGAGFQLGPALRSVSSSETDITSVPPFRVHLFAVIDLPILVLYSRPQKLSVAEGHLVALDANGATGEVPAYTVHFPPGAMVRLPTEDDLQKQPKPMSRNGFTFIGWNTRTDGTGQFYTPGSYFVMGRENVKLYAAWKEKKQPGGT